MIYFLFQQINYIHLNDCVFIQQLDEVKVKVDVNVKQKTHYLLKLIKYIFTYI